MAKEKTLENLFHDTLKDIYYAERKILKTLPKMAKAAQSPELKAAIEKHRNESQGQVERLEQVFEIFGKRAQGKTCEAIEGIIAEGEEIFESRWAWFSSPDKCLLAATHMSSRVVRWVTSR